jgi:hypothetical protein
LLSIAALIFAVLLVAAAVMFYRYTFPGPLTASHDAWGQFGDYIGGVLNPVLAFLSFAALLLALILQGKELR